jgi:hypothetical protein
VILTVNAGHDFGRNTTENFKFLTGLFEFMDDTKSSVTVFIQSSVADILSDISFPRSAEIASMSDSGKNMTILSENEIADEITKSKRSLQAIFKTTVKGFRAPFFAPPKDLWSLLGASGYTYSSSLLQKDVHAAVPKDGVIDKGGVKEIPVQKNKFFPGHFGLPSYRLFYPLSKLFVPKHPRIFYYSTAELFDPFPGKDEGFMNRLLLSVNLGRTARRILYPLLKKFAPTISILEFLQSREVPVPLPSEPPQEPQKEPPEQLAVKPPETPSKNP